MNIVCFLLTHFVSLQKYITKYLAKSSYGKLRIVHS